MSADECSRLLEEEARKRQASVIGQQARDERGRVQPLNQKIGEADAHIRQSASVAAEITGTNRQYVGGNVWRYTEISRLARPGDKREPYPLAAFQIGNRRGSDDRSRVKLRGRLQSDGRGSIAAPKLGYCP